MKMQEGFTQGVPDVSQVESPMPITLRSAYFAEREQQPTFGDISLRLGRARTSPAWGRALEGPKVLQICMPRTEVR